MRATTNVAPAALICALAFGSPGLIVPTPATAQQCELDVRPVQNKLLGYGPRGQRCEGMYIELQSAPVLLRVVSLTRGLPLDSTLDRATELRLARPPAGEFGDSLRILGQPAVAGLNWALDGWVTGSAPFVWNLGEVFRKAGLSLGEIGLLGRTVRKNGSRDPIYVPLSIEADVETASSDSTWILLQIPEARAARICVAGTESCEDLEEVKRGGYHDGYFQSTLPPDTVNRRVIPFVVQWRDSNGSFGHDRFDVLRW